MQFKHFQYFLWFILSFVKLFAVLLTWLSFLIYHSLAMPSCFLRFTYKPVKQLLMLCVMAFIIFSGC